MQIKMKLLPLALLALSPNLFAQQIPGAGSQLRELTPPILPQKNEPSIRITESAAPATTEQNLAKVRVDQLKFSGARIGSETDAELQAISHFTPGSELSLNELEAMAGRITQHYREKGYFVARAYLPAQDISNHVVTIAINEGRLGKVDLRNTSRLDDALANGLLSGLDT
ncbi:MAG: POTRA domain-containing protein, partial [Arenimonas sp.]